MSDTVDKDSLLETITMQPTHLWPRGRAASETLTDIKITARDGQVVVSTVKRDLIFAPGPAKALARHIMAVAREVAND